MLKIINNVVFDTTKAEKICTVKNFGGHDEHLLKTRKNNFFLYAPNDLLPLRDLMKAEVMQWLSENESQLKNYPGILRKHFDLKPEASTPLPENATKLFQSGFETLFHESRGGKFYLQNSFTNTVKDLRERQALAFVEQHQAEVSESTLKQIISNYFPTIKTA